MIVLLEDGRELAVSLEWSSRSSKVSPSQLNNCRFIGNGKGIHWSQLDEDILVENLNNCHKL